MPARRLPRRHRPGPGDPARPTIHLQAPPNLSDATSSADLLAAGIDDWGGVSPVTADHVNPERPWPALDVLRAATEAAGFELAPRLTIYPEFAADPERWLDHGDALRRARPLRRRGPRPRRPRRGVPRAHQGSHRRRHRRRGGADRPPQHGLVQRGVGRRRPRWSPARSSRRRPGRGCGEVLDGIAARPAARRGRARHPVRGPGPRGRRRRRGRRRPPPAARRRRRHLGPQPQHQLHQRLHVQVPVLRLLEGPAVAQPAGQALPAHARGHRRAGASRPPSSAPPRCACRAASTPTSTATTTSTSPGRCTRRRRTSTSTASPPSRSPRAPSGSASRWPTTSAGSWHAGLQHAARHRRRDPRRRGPGHPLPRQDQHRGVARGPPHRPLGRAAQQRHDHVRRRSSRPGRGPEHLVVTRDLQEETGGFTEFVGLPFVHMASPIYLQHKARRGPDLPRGAPHARRRPARLRRADPQRPGLVGEARRRRRPPAPPGRRQRPRRHPDGREHQPGRRAPPTARAWTRTASTRIVDPLGRPLAQRTTLYGRVDQPEPVTV